MLENVIAGKEKLFADGTHTELRLQENRSRRVVLVGGNLVANGRSEEKGISARVAENGFYGFSSKAETTAGAADEVLKAATENARFFDSHVREKRPSVKTVGTGTVPLNKETVDTEQKTYVEFARQIDAYIAEKYPALASRRVILTTDTTEKYILTSDGYSGHVTIPRHYVYVFLTANTPSGAPVELFRAIGGYGNFSDNFSDPSLCFPEIDEVYENVMRKTEGIYAEAGLKTVVLGGDLSGMLAHEAVGHTVEADLVNGGSVAGPNLGKVVASPLVSMVDFANVALGKTAPLPVYLDDEGTPAEDVTLIRDGVLQGYMHNLETAAQYGDRPRGNARAWTYADEPLIRMRNTAVLPGKDSLDDIIASVDDGYYFISTNNGQADLTGEFMFGVCMGYEIKNGKLGRPILDTTITGIAFDMLKTVDMVSNEVHWSSSGFCGKKQPMPVGLGGPALRCKITVGGR